MKVLQVCLRALDWMGEDAYWPPGTNGNQVPVFHQIGGINPVRGDPINRERQALEEIVEALDKQFGRGNYEIRFHDKNSPGNFTVNPHLLETWNEAIR